MTEAEALAGRDGRRGPCEEEEDEERGEAGSFPLRRLILYRPRSDSVRSQSAAGAEKQPVRMKVSYVVMLATWLTPDQLETNITQCFGPNET